MTRHQETMRQPEQSLSCWPQEHSWFILISFRCRAQHCRCTCSPRAPRELQIPVLKPKAAQGRALDPSTPPTPQTMPLHPPHTEHCLGASLSHPCHRQPGKEHKGLLTPMLGTKPSSPDHSTAPYPDWGLAQRAVLMGHKPCCPVPGPHLTHPPWQRGDTHTHLVPQRTRRQLQHL